MEGKNIPPAWRVNEGEMMMDYIDERLSAALQDVPLPEGLANRILERLAGEQLAISGSQQRAEVRSSRRWILAVGSGLLAVAAMLLVAVWLGMHRGENLSEQFVLDEAIRSFNTPLDQLGYPIAEKAGPEEYPFSQAVLPIRGTTWRHLDGFLGHRGVVYDLPGPGGASASLYVVEGGTVKDVGETPAWHPFTTAGCCASAWREGGLLYVLVVQGDPATYRAYLRLPNEPVA
jgi:hypothetical protein